MIPVEPAEVEPPGGEGPSAWSEFWPPLSYWLRVTLVVLAVVLAWRAMSVLGNVILIAVAAFVISLGLQPLLAALERRGWRRGAGMTLIVLTGLVVVAGLGIAIVPTVAGQAMTAFESLPELFADLGARWPMLADIIGDVSIPGAGGAVEGEEAIEFFGSFAVGAFNTVTLVLLVPYFAVGFPDLKSWVLRLLKRDQREDFVYIVNQATELTSNYIVGNLTISLIAGVVSYIAFLVIGLPFSLALAAWVAITDMIPAVGALIGAVPVLIVALMVGPSEFIWALIFLIAYQQVENYMLAPRVMKRAVDLRPPVVILAILVGGALAGVVGALLALPVAAMGKVVATEFMIRRRVELVRDENASATGTPRRRHRGKIGSRPLP